ncbi:MAG: hypothetical protein N2558_02245 [Patescibacteria group bacterium]|nr:hypothetical protein [Patescibacteria group bacterium]
MSILIVYFMFAISFFFFSPIYEEVDDVSMMRMASGQYSNNPSSLLVYINPIYGKLLSFLYTINESFPWYGATFYTLLFVSYVIILSTISAKLNFVNFVLLFIFILPLFIWSIIFLQYTAISSYVVFAGLLLACWNCYQNKNVSIALQIASIIFVLIGGLIRKESFIYVFAISSPILVYSFLKNKNKMAKKFLAYFVITSLILFGLSTKIGNKKYNISLEWTEYMHWINTQSLFHEYNLFNYDKNEDIYKKFNWSYNDYLTLSNWFYFDKGIYNTQTLSQILNQSILKNISYEGIKFTIDTILTTISAYSSIVMQIIFFSGTICFVNATTKNQKTYIFATLMISAAIVTIFCFLGRVFPTRLMHPYLLITATSAIYFLNKAKTLKPSISTIILLTIYLITSLNTTLTFMHFASYNQIKTKNFKEILKILPQENLIINWASSIPIHWISPLEARTFENIDLIGTGWPIRSPYEGPYLQKYNISNVYLDIIDNKNVYLVATEKHLEIYQKFLDEHYGVKINTVKLADLTLYEIHPRYSYGAKVYQIISDKNHF